MDNILVVDLMTRDPITVKPDTNLLECAKKMVKKGLGSLLIADKKKLVGFISQRDILWAMTKKPNGDLTKIRAIEISPKKIATIKPSATLKDVIDKMNKVKFDRLPVIQKNELVGVITVKDILNFHPELYDELDELAQIREEAKKLERLKRAKERKSLYEGICEECGNQDFLRKINGALLCESCIDSI